SAAVPIWGSHYLNDQDGMTLAAAATAAGKKVWYTEVGDGSADINGALGLARGIDSAFNRDDASAWLNWQITGQPPNEDLLRGTSRYPTPDANYYALKQCAHFIRPGAVRIDTAYSGNDVRISAFQDAPNNA